MRAHSRARATAETQPFRHFGGDDRSRADAVTGDRSVVSAISRPISGASRRTRARPTANEHCERFYAKRQLWEIARPSSSMRTHALTAVGAEKEAALAC
jgi:hypothetical protein